jgi:EF-P beta-lysylation protein EpmB
MADPRTRGLHVPAHCTPQVATPRWQSELARGYCDLDELLADLGLAPGDLALPAAARAFPLRVPRGFVARMRRGDPRDPLLLQVLPTAAEAAIHPGYTDDPVGDLASEKAPGLLHKYGGRALLVATGACAVHCRYCFRRNFPYAGHSAGAGRLPAALAAIGQDASIHEVILSGGDPLTLSDRRLAGLLDAIGAFDHVRRIRLHTRLPIVLPERVDPGLMQVLRGTGRPVVVVVHANHPREVDGQVAAALQGLRACVDLLLNQSVLLRAVNDEATTLAELSERLFAAGVLPYYLHQLDPVAGAAHFAVSDAKALELHAALRASLPGYLVPQLVREVPGAAAKMPLVSHSTT